MDQRERKAWRREQYGKSQNCALLKRVLSDAQKLQQARLRLAVLATELQKLRDEIAP